MSSCSLSFLSLFLGTLLLFPFDNSTGQGGNRGAEAAVRVAGIRSGLGGFGCCWGWNDFSSERLAWLFSFFNGSINANTF
ncbi:hypothetical protein DsansV1_C07g0073621 [Dioscorea sansibarensis]